MSQGSVKQIFEVSDRLRDDCYSIVNIAGGDAMKVYHLIQADVRERRGIMFTHDYNGFVTGFLKAHFTGQKSEAFPIGDGSMIDWFYVDKNYQRKGIGQQLFQAYIKYMLLHNIHDIRLHSEASTKALSFYQKYGFEITGPELLMTKKITEKVI